MYQAGEGCWFEFLTVFRSLAFCGDRTTILSAAGAIFRRFLWELQITRL